MELSPLDRLRAFIAIHYPALKFDSLTMADKPGFVLAGKKLINIRGAGYPARTAELKLWRELHWYFRHRVEVIKLKNNAPTKIMWKGRTYILDHKSTYREEVTHGINKRGYSASRN